MEILLVTATLPEMRAVLTGLCPAPQTDDLLARLQAAPRKESGEPQSIPLPLRGGSLRLLVCGVGPVAAALSLGLFLGQYLVRRPSGLPAGGGSAAFGSGLLGVVNFGLAGSYDPASAPLGSIALATKEVWPEYGLVTEAGVNPQGTGFAQLELEGEPVFNSLALDPQNALGNMGLNCHSPAVQGTSVTVAGVTGSPALAAKMAANGLTENMEGFALALGAARMGLPFAEIRAVSNEVGFRPPQRWDIQTALGALGEAARHTFGPLLPHLP